MKEAKLRTHLDRGGWSGFDSYVLGGDIGGTNTNLAVAGVSEGRPKVLYSLHYASREIESIAPVLADVLKEARDAYGINVTKGAIAVAGPVSDGYGSLTNLEWDVCAKEIRQATALEDVRIINDFQAIGSGINFLDHGDERDIRVVRDQGDRDTRDTKAVIGAGTGLGKTILAYDSHLDAHVPLASEGGHADLPVYDERELEITAYLKGSRELKSTTPVSYEEVLGGNGLVSLYEYVRSQNPVGTQYTARIDASVEKAALISEYREKDASCRQAFKLYARFFARCAKNFVLDSMASGGLYIAGGIASKNFPVFTGNPFLEEFTCARKQSQILASTPVYVIMNYDVSLYGACFAAML